MHFVPDSVDVVQQHQDWCLRPSTSDAPRLHGSAHASSFVTDASSVACGMRSMLARCSHLMTWTNPAEPPSAISRPSPRTGSCSPKASRACARSVFEVFPGRNAFWDEDIVYCYAWTIRPNMVKGWGLHQEKVDRYTLINGEIITVLCDARADSPTHGQVQQVVLSEQGVRQVRIPTGVWHMNVNVCQVEAHLINHPTRPYQHDNPDRLVLPWNTDAIPYDLRTLVPVQANPCPPCGAP